MKDHRMPNCFVFCFLAGIIVLSITALVSADSTSGNVLPQASKTAITGQLNIGLGQTDPWNMVTDPTTNRVYLLSYTSGMVASVDGITHAGVASQYVGPEPQNMCLHKSLRKLYVLARNKIRVLDAQSLALVQTLTLSVEGSGIAVNEATNTVYVQAHTSLYLIDATTDSVRRQVSYESLGLIYIPEFRGRVIPIAVHPQTNRVFLLSSSATLAVLDGEATKVLARIEPPNGFLNFQGMDFNPVTGNLVIWNRGHDFNGIRIINPTTYVIVNQFTPQDLLSGCLDPISGKVIYSSTPDVIYVADEAGNQQQVQIQFPPNSDISSFLPIGVLPGVNKILIAGVPFLLAVDRTPFVGRGQVLSYSGQRLVEVHPGLEKLYVATNYDGIQVFDTGTNQRIRKIPFPSGVLFFNREIALDRSANRLFVQGYSTTNTNSYYVFDCLTDSLIAVLPLVDKSIAVNSNLHRAYFTSTNGGLQVLDTVTLQTVATLSIPPSNRPVVNLSTNRVYCPGYASATVTVVDGNTNSLLPGFSLDFPCGDTDFVINSQTNRALVKGLVSGQPVIQVIDLNSQTKIGNISGLKSLPYRLAVNPRTNRLFLLDSPGLLTVIDLSNNSILESLKLDGLPLDLTLNEVTNRLYVSDVYSDLITVVDNQAPAPVPALRFYPLASTSGKTISVYGSGFVSGVTQVFFGGGARIASPQVTVVSPTELRAVVPPSASGSSSNVNGYLTVRIGLDTELTTEKLPAQLIDPSNPNASFPEFALWGDISGDGAVTTADAALARGLTLFQFTPTPRQMLAADVYPANPNGSRGNGQVTATDFTLLRAVLNGQATF
ncbi:MAG: hypothetical protein K1Y36_13785 [Blastocatellia bacterium]|nr:hypothetical protein [Blastocatellia bacterium]